MSDASGGHYYTRDGKPAHTQKTKPGAKNATRPTTIADAKRLGLLPSVTGITSVLSSPQLQRWREKQIIEACFEASPGPEESLEGYTEWITERAFSRVKDASDLGSRVHAILEDVYNGEGYDENEGLVFPTSGKAVPAKEVIAPVIAAVAALNIKVKECEAVVVEETLGYAGTTDLPFVAQDNSTLGVLDWKTKKTKPGESIYPSETYPMQIAAYVHAYWGGIGPSSVGHNVFISTTEPGRVEIVSYDCERLRKEREAFEHCVALWQWRHNYYPGKRRMAA